MENFEGSSFKSPFTFKGLISEVNPTEKRKCTPSFDILEETEIELKLSSLKKWMSYKSVDSICNKFESQSTNFMSDNNFESSFSMIINSINENSNFNSAFSLQENNNSGFSNFSNCILPNSNLENILNQNLIISEDVIKIIVVGDKAVGKSFFVNKFCENNCISNVYEPTLR